MKEQSWVGLYTRLYSVAEDRLEVSLGCDFTFPMSVHLGKNRQLRDEMERQLMSRMRRFSRWKLGDRFAI